MDDTSDRTQPPTTPHSHALNPTDNHNHTSHNPNTERGLTAPESDRKSESIVTDEDRAFAARFRSARTTREQRALEAEMSRAHATTPEAIAYRRNLTHHDPDALWRSTDRGFGKTAQPIDIGTEDGAAIPVSLDGASEGLLAFLALLAGAGAHLLQAKATVTTLVADNAPEAPATQAIPGVASESDKVHSVNSDPPETPHSAPLW